MLSKESYNNDWVSVGLEAECPTDSASFFNFDYQNHDDLKNMLDSSRDSLKLEAMKRIIEMVARGKDVSNLFPSVVKNVVSKKIEIKKLVYVYLVRYAEEQQDLALLSISTFQRALKEPNQLIRASALRVLSNIRVSMIVPIVLLAIRDAAADMSPYVRKTAAHAIPKLYRLDQKQKLELIIVIQKLLADQTVLVIGSAVMAFLEVCPEREDLIHPIFRKLCALLADVDEWGQVVIVNMLTRYARTQFSDPNVRNNNEIEGNDEKKICIVLDPDHRLLISCTRPLLQTQNASVVMAVAQLYHHCAPKKEAIGSARALVRLLRSHVEVQNVVLNTIASISSEDKRAFQPYLKSFFVRVSDPTHVKLLKLDILINLATDCTASTILRELQAYLSSTDKKFVAASIQAIGRCAYLISEVTDSCLNRLVILLSNKNEAVVAESVIVIKRLLQMQSGNFKEIITHMARLLDTITIPQARAAIVWLLGEHSRDLQIAPDVLRKLTKTFSEEHDIVKLQILNLAVKLYITNSDQIQLLCQYVFNLARYDHNYDIRDRARLLKHFTGNQPGMLVSQASKIFLVTKPAPLLKSHFTIAGRDCFQLGSLSHYINARAVGYEPLPSFPQEPPPREVRDVEGEAEDSIISDNCRSDTELLSSGESETEESSSTSTSNDSSCDSSDLLCNSTVADDVCIAQEEFEKENSESE